VHTASTTILRTYTQYGVRYVEKEKKMRKEREGNSNDRSVLWMHLNLGALSQHVCTPLAMLSRYRRKGKHHRYTTEAD